MLKRLFKHSKEIVSLLLVAIMLCTSFSVIGIPQVKAAETSVAKSVKIPKDSDPNADRIMGYYGTNPNGYHYKNGWYHKYDPGKYWFHAIGSSDGPAAYCLEPGVGVSGSYAYTINNITTYFTETLSGVDLHNEFFNSATKRARLIEILQKIIATHHFDLAYIGNVDPHWSSANTEDAQKICRIIATQLLIWETIVGERDTDFNYVAPESGFDSIISGIDTNDYLYNGIMDYYNRIEAQVQSMLKTPSISSSSYISPTKYTLTWDNATKTYRATITDTNGVLERCTVSCQNSNIQLTKSGNTLTISSSVPVSNVLITITDTQKSVTTKVLGDSVFFSGERYQDLIAWATDASVMLQTFIGVSTNDGSLSISKASEDGFVEGVSFSITDNNGTVLHGATDATGVVSFSGLHPGTWTVSEGLLDKYVAQSSKNVTVNGGQTTNVSFSNVLKRFRIVIQKYNSWGMEGDGTIEGAQYGLYRQGVLMETIDIDANGNGTSSYYVCDTADWTVKEITAPRGFMLDTRTYSIEPNATLFIQRYNNINLRLPETPERGTIEIFKQIGPDEDSQEVNIDPTLTHPERGAQFQVYLQSAGSYDSALADERDILTTDEHGHAISKLLPYGVYVVHQITSSEESGFVDDFTVSISQADGSPTSVYKFLLTNKSYKSYVKIVKLDDETGQIIQEANAGFKIYDSQGHVVSMTVGSQSVDVFYTDSDGTLMTPDYLEYGEYTLLEVQAPFGYAINSTPVIFSISSATASGETNNGLPVVIVRERDVPQKTNIEITKEGEGFASVVTSGSGSSAVYTPIYDTLNLKDAVFQIIAAEDIITPDGTLRYNQGQIVDTVTTNAGGVALSEPLYLGKYQIKEVSAPYGYILDTEVHEITLSYTNQSVLINTKSTSLFNTRQKVQVSLQKVLEKNALYDLGNNDEILAVSFGLYANEDIVAANGDVIPKDGLIEIGACDVNGSITFTSDLPVGKYYVKERTTDSHYVLDNSKYEFEFVYDNTQTGPIQIKIGENDPIVNTYIRGSITGHKYAASGSQSGQGLAGAVIGIFDGALADAELTIDNAYKTTTTDANGLYSFSELPLKTYKIKELSSPNGFNNDSAIITVTLDSAHKNVSEQDFVDTPITGSLSIKKVDALTDAPLQGVEFTVYTANGTVIETKTTDEFGKVSFGPYEYGQYKFKETATIDGYTIDNPDFVDFSILENGKTYTFTVEDHPCMGRIEIYKQGERFTTVTARTVENTSIYTPVFENRYLEGAVYEIRAVNNIVTADGTVRCQAGELVDTVTTNSEGKAQSVYLFPGLYSIKEVTAPYGYVLDDTVHTVELVYDRPTQTVPVQMHTHENARQKVVFNLAKLMKQTNAYGIVIGNNNEITNVVFGLYAAEQLTAADGTSIPKDGLIETKHVSSDGTLSFDADVPFGNYYVKEISTDAHYQLNINKFDVSFVYDASGTLVQQISVNNGQVIINELIFGNVKIIKSDSETGKKLSGAEFDLFVEGNEMPIAHGTTDENGELTFEGLPYGNYFYQETKAPNGYLIDNPVKTPLSIVANGIMVEIEETDTVQMGVITIKKMGDIFQSVQIEDFEGTPLYQPVYEWKFLANAKFDIIAAEDIYSGGELKYAKDTVVDSVETIDGGIATSIPLYLGKYNVVETAAPFGFVLDHTEHLVELAYAGQNYEISSILLPIKDDPQKAQIVLIKSMEENEKFKIGKNGEIEHVQFAIYAKADITAEDGTIIPKDGLVDVVTCAVDGTITYGKLLPIGDYYFKEYSTDEHYVLSDEQFDFQIAYDDSGAPSTFIQVNDGNAVINHIILGPIVGQKVDDNGNPLHGGLFGLFFVDEDPENMNEETALMVAESDETGAFTFENVPYGQYKIKEIKAPEGFIPSDNIIIVSVPVNPDGEALIYPNTPITNTIKIYKSDAETDEPIANVHFVIYNEAKEIVAEGDTNEEGLLEIILTYGKYSYKETDGPINYVINDSEEFDFSVTIDGETLEFNVQNTKKYGQVTILKLNAEGEEPLAGAEFTIYDENHEVIGVYTTDESGKIVLELPYGKYTYKETKAPADFQIDDDSEHEFEIVNDGDQFSFVAKDTRVDVPTPVLGYDNSETTMMLLMNILLMVAIVNFLGITLLTKRRR